MNNKDRIILTVLLLTASVLLSLPMYVASLAITGAIKLLHLIDLLFIFPSKKRKISLLIYLIYCGVCFLVESLFIFTLVSTDVDWKGIIPNSLLIRLLLLILCQELLISLVRGYIDINVGILTTICSQCGKRVRFEYKPGNIFRCPACEQNFLGTERRSLLFDIFGKGSLFFLLRWFFRLIKRSFFLASIHTLKILKPVKLILTRIYHGNLDLQIFTLTVITGAISASTWGSFCFKSISMLARIGIGVALGVIIGFVERRVFNLKPPKGATIFTGYFLSLISLPTLAGILLIVLFELGLFGSSDTLRFQIFQIYGLLLTIIPILAVTAPRSFALVFTPVAILVSLLMMAFSALIGYAVGLFVGGLLGEAIKAVTLSNVNVTYYLAKIGSVIGVIFGLLYGVKDIGKRQLKTKAKKIDQTNNSTPEPFDEKLFLFDKLKQKTLGDEETAHRLTNYERRYCPGASEEELIQRAIERLERDKR